MIWHVTHISFFDHPCRLPQTPDWSSMLSVMSPLSLPTITHQCWVPTGTLLVSAVCLASHVTSGRGLYRSHGRFIVNLTCCALWCNYVHVFAFMYSVFIAIPSKRYFCLPIDSLPVCCTLSYLLSAYMCVCVCVCVFVCVCVCVFLCQELDMSGVVWKCSCTTAGESPSACSTWTWCRGL